MKMGLVTHYLTRSISPSAVISRSAYSGYGTSIGSAGVAEMRSLPFSYVGMFCGEKNEMLLKYEESCYQAAFNFQSGKYGSKDIR